VDEMMVRFVGRSVHTVRMPNKPIPEGFKVLALCEHGYTFSFIYTSRVDQFSTLQHDLPNLEDEYHLSLSPTSRAVFFLATQLPYQQYSFLLFCDNYFSNIPLFQALRNRQIAACGTVRPNSAEYPRILKLNKQRTILPWGTVSGVIPTNREVLAIIWQDKSLVRLLTTAYDMRPNAENYTTRTRRRPRRPRNRNAYRDMIDEVWGELPVRELALPTATVDYNMHMGGVDIADQHRSYYSTQLRVLRTCMPLFFWLLDTTVINAFLIARQQMEKQQTRTSCWQTHLRFRERLAWDLVEEGFRQLNPTRIQELQLVSPPNIPSPNGRHCPGVTPKGNNSLSRAKGYVTKYSSLPPMRKDPVTHKLTRNPTKQKSQLQYCFLCRFLSKNPIQTQSSNPNSSESHSGHPSTASLSSLSHLPTQHLPAQHCSSQPPITQPPLAQPTSAPTPARPTPKIRRTVFVCCYCEISGFQVPLCKDNCFKLFHTMD